MHPDEAFEEPDVFLSGGHVSISQFCESGQSSCRFSRSPLAPSGDDLSRHEVLPGHGQAAT